ncbi:peptide chain release factor 2 [Candidatus Parcubacteria bacterium A4]|nr:MAG: peptide chain release factor 2 [Candidatus Parcubacteria bacterium A4]
MIVEMEKETQIPNFWERREDAVRISQELSQLKEDVAEMNCLKDDFEIVKDLDDESELKKLEKRIMEKERMIFLSGKYDKGNAFLTIYSGAGGQDAQDWATILLRMYEKYCSRKNFKVKILDQAFGEGGGPEGRVGTKQVSLEIMGKYAYGFLKKEGGVHRLVRISPFSSKSLRHTSFALVEVLPEIKEGESVVISPDDITVDLYRSSGPGGQNVNKRETAVRITHLSTGIVVACQSERLQGSNKQKALDILYSKLYEINKDNKKKEMSNMKGGKVSAEWGNQIRSYIVHPYKMVKDLRTDVETSDAENVLDGCLDDFIEAEIKLKS